MSANSKKTPESYAEQLADFDSRLGEQGDDERLLRDVHTAIRTLLAGGATREADIRSVLRKRLADGKLRNESFQLVQNMLDQIVGEHAAAVAAANDEPDEFVITTVIPDQSAGVDETAGILQAGSVLCDRYLLQHEVAAGDMGSVYKALDRQCGDGTGEQKFVAVRTLPAKLVVNEKALRALQQECAKARCLVHPNIERFIDLEREQQTRFIVTEWLAGETVASMLDGQRAEAIDRDSALDIVRQVGRALDYAHRCGVVHADIKPGNVMMMASGQAKLLDFGIARIRQKMHDGKPHMRPGESQAKRPAYSSMQVLTGEDPVPADDVFSLACLMYRLVAGYRVFGPRNAAEAAAEGMEPQRPQDLTDTQWSALRKALAYARVARFASPAAFLKAFDADRTIAEAPAEIEILGDEEPQRRLPWRAVALVAIAGALTAVAMQDNIMTWPGRQSAAPVAAVTPVSEPTDSAEDTRAAAPAVPSEPPPAAPRPEESVAVQPSVSEDLQDLGIEAPAAAPAYVPVDYSALPPPDLLLRLASDRSEAVESSLTLREDAMPAIVDLVRGGSLEVPMTVRIEEASYNGNQSPLQSGQYRIDADGVVSFAAGQERARTGISMLSDPLREADRQVLLRIPDPDSAATELGLISLRLEDDDQRRFEAGLQPDTVAFAVSQVSVHERDPAVQVDVLRFKPANTALEVSYSLRDVTATNGEDYFAPDSASVSFAPGQRSARILIPLVQDSTPEPDEAFMLELMPAAQQANANIFVRIAVMIRDDDS